MMKIAFKNVNNVVKIWVAYAPPPDPIDHSEPAFRVAAPRDWGRDRVFEALEKLGYRVASLSSLPGALVDGLWQARFCHVPVGERLKWAWNYLGPLIILPSGRKSTPRGGNDDGYYGRVEVLPSRYPKADVSVRYFVDSGYHVFRVVSRDVPKDFFDRVSQTLGDVLEEFIGVRCFPIDYGYEVEILPHVQLTDLQVRSLCKLLHRLTERFLRRGILRYRRRVASPWVAHPDDYLRLGLTEEEVKAIQSLIWD
ncbi:hypothetical protein [Thermocrinis sp.]|uniref:hypothetical protein n=1 Tax=Thermocrinis sp. TaxID=2024383 RepID=UPI003C0957DE